MSTPETLAAAFEAACRAELEALKPGNVHVHAGGHRMSVDDFERSAAAAAPAMLAPASGVGERVLHAVTATRAAVGHNTNLGILLLCAPLVEAALRGGPLRPGVAAVLRALSIEDAAHAFAAICLAAPGGLGESVRHDVRDPPGVGLREAMAEAAPRDRIAWNYANGMADPFETGLPALERAVARGWARPWCATAVYLRFLAAWPDTHLQRRHGSGLALRVQDEAVRAEQALLRCAAPESARAGLLAFDAALKRLGANPGTSADLTVATLFTAGIDEDVDWWRC